MGGSSAPPSSPCPSRHPNRACEAAVECDESFAHLASNVPRDNRIGIGDGELGQRQKFAAFGALVLASRAHHLAPRPFRNSTTSSTTKRGASGVRKTVGKSGSRRIRSRRLSLQLNLAA